MKRLALALGFTMSLLAADTAIAHTAQVGSLQVIHPWVAPAEKGASTVANPTISNNGDDPIEITKAVSAAAGEIELKFNGRTVDTFTVEPGETLTPEQIQIELRDLQVDLPEGKGVPLTLHTRKGDELEIVLSIGEETMDPQQMVSVP